MASGVDQLRDVDRRSVGSPESRKLARGKSRRSADYSFDGVTARNPNIKVSAKVTSNHGALLKKDAPAIAAAVREVANLGRGV